MKTEREKTIRDIRATLKLLVRREREKAAEALGLSRRCAAHQQHASRTLTRFNRLVAQGVIVLAFLASLGIANADDHKRDRHERRQMQPNWILERQSAGQVQGVPTSRIIVGRREIDIYPNGLMFEKGNVVGIRPTR